MAITHCEKCISYDMCNYEYEHCDTDAVLTFFPNNTDCPWFKNKADFVEVVRCKNCVHKFVIEGRCMCNINAKEAFGKWFGLRATHGENFCGFGERKDNDG